MHYDIVLHNQSLNACLNSATYPNFFCRDMSAIGMPKYTICLGSRG